MGTRTVLFVAICALACGCAQAGKESLGGDHPDGGTGLHPAIDADNGTHPDAPGGADATVMLDAPTTAGPHTLAGTSATTDDRSAIACSASDANGVTLYTDQNSYYRVFPLADFGITTTFHVSRVDFAVETATGGPTDVTVKVGTYGGTVGDTLTKNKIASTTQKTQSIANAATSESVALTNDIAAGGILIVEIDSASGQTAMSEFFMGANGGAETEPSYISSTVSGCGATSPTKLSTLGLTTTPAWLITVTGTSD